MNDPTLWGIVLGLFACCLPPAVLLLVLEDARQAGVTDERITFARRILRATTGTEVAVLAIIVAAILGSRDLPVSAGVADTMLAVLIGIAGLTVVVAAVGSLFIAWRLTRLLRSTGVGKLRGESRDLPN